MNTRILTLGILAALLAAGCQQSASDKADDVSEARADSAKSVADARDDAAKQRAESNKDVAEARTDQAEVNQEAREDVNEVTNKADNDAALAQFEIAKAKAEGAHEIAVQKCDMQSGLEKDACIRLADANRTEDLANAEVIRDQAILDRREYD